MKAPFYLLLLLLVPAICTVSSCKKKNNGSPFSNARIALVDKTHSGAIEHFRYYYDQYANVDSCATTGDGTASGIFGYKKFTYFGSSFSIKDETGFSFDVYANTAGYILKVLLTDTLIMHYKGTLIDALDTKTALASYPYYSITTLYYTWTNGDMTYVGPSGPGGTTYYYDLSRSGQPGDVLRIEDFLAYGRSYIRSTHLPAGAIVGTDTVEKYYYQYDTYGRISQLMNTSSYSGVLDTYTYDYKYY